MSDTPLRNDPNDRRDQIEPSEPLEDPIVSRSLSVPILISALLLFITLMWALYEEALGHRPWRRYQAQFAELYGRYLSRVKPVQEKDEVKIRQTPEYRRLDEAVKLAEATAAPRLREIDQQLAQTNRQLAALQEPFTLARSEVSALIYKAETAESEGSRQRLMKKLAELKKGPFKVEMPADNGSNDGEKVSFPYDDLEAKFNELKRRQGELLSARGLALKPAGELRKTRDEYVVHQMEGLTPEQLAGLQAKVRRFPVEIKQINIPVAGMNWVERCESCHVGIREPVTLAKADMGGRSEFVTHPNKELLEIHDPERFGCTPCHGGNGVATTSVEKAHGNYEHWLWPMHHRDNTEAGCQQCHSRDIVLANSNVFERGKQLFLQRGCWGCHFHANFDPEPGQIQATQKTIQQLQEKKEENLREASRAERQGDRARENTEAQQLYQRAENLRVASSNVDAEIEQQTFLLKSLLMEQKKVGPNLKDVRLKLRKEWVPLWIQNPQNFRPATKMPRFRLSRDEVQAISAFIWQSATPNPAPAAIAPAAAPSSAGSARAVSQKPAAASASMSGPASLLASQPPGDSIRGKEAFESRGCMACHSMGEGSERAGGTFAANLTRVGEKANYDYVVRWIHNPRQRTMPYCPKEKRDIPLEDYIRNNKPYLFDEEHSRCPNDGAELVVQQMTAMPSLRLTWEEARDIASYLMQQKKPQNYPATDFMDDPNLMAKGRSLVRNYGCAGCHEIAGLEEEQRIGTELTLEGSKPIERLDFALLTEKAKSEGWYNHKGFFERKLADPAVYDKGKLKAKTERLKMPHPNLDKDQINAITTFLVGSVDSSTIPKQYFFNPDDQRRDVQDGWWIVQKYNCMGCHTLRPGQKAALSELSQYSEAKEKLPPNLLQEGARVDPNWLIRFLKDPSLSEKQNHSVQQGMATAGAANEQARAEAFRGAQASSAAERERDRNGVRSYLAVRMPTFNFSERELRTLVKFFEGQSHQPEPYTKQPVEPLTEQEKVLARQLFTSTAAPCLKCHATGDPGHDQNASAPNFLFVKERLKPAWTKRWIINPQLIHPGTAMPSGLFRREGNRWVFNGQLPESFNQYDKDHADLLVRYMFYLTPEEQAKSR
ncbi:MAG TPA: cytochrome c [Acidobacteriota bacterium]|jgi:cytochrome c551/c552